MRTATIERYETFGMRAAYHLRVTYRGRLLHWVAERCSVHADAPDYGAESIAAMRQHAKNQGFTHFRIVGDWSGRTKPKGGKL